MIKNYSNYIFLFTILFIICFLYQRYQSKLDKNQLYNYEGIQKYLSGDYTDLDNGRIKKPIIWIFLDYDYNSRNWLSFGSRSSYDLNQPYLYLTVKSIISKCDKSFTICIIDDSSFKKLIPGWNINMTSISDPIFSNMRTLGLTKLLE